MKRQLIVERLGHSGDGVVQMDDGPHFLPFALPGETVEIPEAPAAEGNSLVRPKIVIPSADRVQPVCARFGRCGGCAIQHLAEEPYLAWKRELVVQALSARGLESEVLSVIPARPGSRRRLGVSAVRTKSGVALGLNGRASHEIVDISDCRVAAPSLLAALPTLQALAGPLLSRKGRLSITVTETETGVDVAIEGAKPLDGALRNEVMGLAKQGDFCRVTIDGEMVVTRRAPVIKFGDLAVKLPPGGFLQATREGEDALVAAAEDALAGARRIADLFAGSGTFAAHLAKQAAVHAVEGDKAALQSFDEAVRAQGSDLHLKPVSMEPRDLFKRPLQARELNRFDAVLFDPPRAGAEAQTRELALSDISSVVAVSCNPATLARDLRLLVDSGFELGPVQPVDQFLWSPHIECIVTARRKRRSKR